MEIITKTFMDLNFEEIVFSKGISKEKALELILSDYRVLPQLIAISNALRTHYFGQMISLCGNAYALWSKCSEDCAYCLLSGHYDSKISPQKFKSADEIINAARARSAEGADRFKIITPGVRFDTMKEFNIILEAISKIKKETNLFLCASLGLLSEESAKALKEAGLDQYNHNLETSEKYFSKICTTHSFTDRINTIKHAKQCGLKVCCGGIIGLGESPQDRISLAFTLKELNVDSLPYNTFVPWPGTPLENHKPPEPLELIKTLAIFRMILPDKHIVLGAGREVNLRDLQPLAILAGPSGMMLPSYLSTKQGGRTLEQDLQMLRDLNMEILQNGCKGGFNNV